MGDFTVCPTGAAGAATGAAGATSTAGARDGDIGAGAMLYVTGAAAMTGALLTMRTLPSASVISSSDTFDSDTRSISVFSFLKSMISPTKFGQVDLKAFNFIEMKMHQPAGVPQCTRSGRPSTPLSART